MTVIAPPDPSRHRLLIVDDEPSILLAMHRYFQALGFHVDCAREREEAEVLLMHVPYDCLIADLCLTPGHGPDGLEVIGFARMASPRTRIVVLTAVEDPTTEDEALRLGADLFLRKPTLVAQVARAVHTLLRNTA